MRFPTVLLCVGIVSAGTGWSRPARCEDARASAEAAWAFAQAHHAAKQTTPAKAVPCLSCGREGCSCGCDPVTGQGCQCNRPVTTQPVQQQAPAPFYYYQPTPRSYSPAFYQPAFQGGTFYGGADAGACVGGR